MGKLSDALGMGETDVSDVAPPSIPGDVEELDAKAGGSAEVLAMKQFKRATTPEAMASAMKDFLEACGALGSDY